MLIAFMVTKQYQQKTLAVSPITTLLVGSTVQEWDLPYQCCAVVKSQCLTCPGSDGCGNSFSVLCLSHFADAHRGDAGMPFNSTPMLPDGQNSRQAPEQLRGSVSSLNLGAAHPSTAATDAHLNAVAEAGRMTMNGPFVPPAVDQGLNGDSATPPGTLIRRPASTLKM